MKALRFDNGGKVAELLKMLESVPPQRDIPLFNPSRAVAESTRRSSPTRAPFDLEKEIAANESEIFHFYEGLNRRNAKKEEQIARLGFDPMHSGRAESISPGATYLSPVGDVQDMVESGHMFSEGLKEKNPGKALTGAGLGLASAAFAFLPGNVSMLRAWGADTPGPSTVINRLANQLDAGKTNADDIYRSMELGDLPRIEKANAGKDIHEYLAMADDPNNLLSEMMTDDQSRVLKELADGLMEGDMPSVVNMLSRQAVLPEVRHQSPDIIPSKTGDFNLTDTSSGNSLGLSYENPRGDYMELNIDPIGSRAGHLRNMPESILEKYGDKHIASMNMRVASSPVTAGKLFNELNKHISKGDILFPGNGSLSLDSYGPFLLKQLERGKAGKPGRGVKKLTDSGIPKEDGIKYFPLNTMGKNNLGFFGTAGGMSKTSVWNEGSNLFNIPLEDRKILSLDNMLTTDGTLTSREAFKDPTEAAAYIESIAKKYIDPVLKEAGLPPTRMVSMPGTKNHKRLEFPIPFVEKLRKGGRIPLKVKKKRKAGVLLTKKQ